METLGLDQYVGTYDLYRGDDGYIYRTVPNRTHGISDYNPLMNGVNNGARNPDIVEPPDARSTSQRANSNSIDNYWQAPHHSVPTPFQDFQGTEDFSQLAPDIRLATSRGLNGPSERQVAIVSNYPPFSSVVNLPDRYYDASSVHIDGIIPSYVPDNAAYDHSSPPVTPTVAQSADKVTGSPEDDEEQDTGHDELPLIRLPFGAWKCGLCEKQLRRRHRAVVHFLNKHGDMRLSCQRRCGSTDCKKTFASQDGLDVHLKPVVMECAFCGKKLLKKNILRHRSRHCHPEDATNKGMLRRGPISSSESPSS